MLCHPWHDAGEHQRNYIVLGLHSHYKLDITEAVTGKILVVSHTPVEMKVEGLEKFLSVAFNPRFMLL